jgi:nucleoside-diphosphate-sugar epimerase
MNILVTGSSGFLGREIFSKLIINHSVFDLNRNTGKYRIDLANSIPVFDEEYYLVVHNAGIAHFVPKTKEEIDSFFNVNVQGTLNLLKALETGIPKLFVFISSISVYGKDFGLGIDENASLGALDPYGVSKIEAEKIVLDWCKQHNVLCTILRLPLIVGPNPPGNLGAMVKGIKKCYYFNIAGGRAKKSMVLAEDVADFVLHISAVGGVYNLTDGVHPSFKELSFAIAKKKVFNLPFFLAQIFGVLGDFLGENAPVNSLKVKKITSDLTFDDTKARNVGWNPQSVLNYLKNNDLYFTKL